MVSILARTVFFDNSELAATGLPSEDELAVLEPYRDQLPVEVFTKEYRSPKTDGSGKYRDNLVRALDLFAKAGWELRDGRMTNKATGEPLFSEFLLVSPQL